MLTALTAAPTTAAPRRWRTGLAAATAISAGLLAQHPANAQDASQLAAIQAQIASLTAQLKRLQRQSAQRDDQLRQAQSDAATARAEAQQAIAQARARPIYVPGPATGQYAAAPYGGSSFAPPNPGATSLQSAAPASITTTAVDKSNPAFRLGGVTVTLGGYIDTTTIFRSRNLTSGTSSPFNSIPFGNSPNAHIGEFRETAQPTRFSVLASGSPGPGQSVAGYLEGDFSGAATTANSNQTNSYTPRLRLAYTQYDNTNTGWHLLAGQDWSLVTGNTVGITPRKELVPPTIDSAYVVGFAYTRAPQIRVVKDFGGKLWLGASLEAPQETYTAAGITASGVKLPNGQTVSYNNPGASFLNSLATYSYDTAPDLVVKAAADTPFGHYEVFGLGSFFRTRTSVTGGGANHNVFGGGVGGDMSVHVIPKYLDLVGNVMVGDGIGRYGAGGLPDATIDQTGQPVPLREGMGLVGLIGHPSPAFDLYSYAGVETIGRSTFTGTVAGVKTGFGYGTQLASTAGCGIELGSCSAQTRALDDLSVGGWWRFLHGGYGTVQAGFQYSYVKRIAFSGTAGRPSTDDNILFFSLRFLPFQ